MPRIVSKWAIPSLVVVVVAVGFALQSYAQYGEQQPGQKPGEQPPAHKQPSMGGDDINHAKEMSKLIQQGQLKLPEAIEIAEKHTKGTALEALCGMEHGTSGVQKERKDRPGSGDQEPLPGQQPKPGEQPKDQPRTGERETPGPQNLVWEVACFADDKIQVCRIDGLTKKVIDVNERKTLTRSSGR